MIKIVTDFLLTVTSGILALLCIIAMMAVFGSCAPRIPEAIPTPRMDAIEAQVDTLAYHVDMQGFLLEALFGEIEMLKEEILYMPDGEVYQIKPGDNLWDIAGRELGDPNRWVEIWLLNLWTVREADMIFPGQILKVTP